MDKAAIKKIATNEAEILYTFEIIKKHGLSQYKVDILKKSNNYTDYVKEITKYDKQYATEAEFNRLKEVLED